MKRTTTLIIILLLLTGVVLAGGTPTIEWDVTGGGGGHAAAGIYTLDTTIGQPVTGVAMNTGAELCAGFWCGPALQIHIYLPKVAR